MRYLTLIEADKIRFLKIKTGNRPVLRVGTRIYRADESIFLRDRQSNDALLIYDADGTQPHGHQRYYDPDIVRIYVDSAKLKNRGKTFTELGGIMETVGKNAIAIAVALIIIAGFIMGLMG